MDKQRRTTFEDLLDELHQFNYQVTSDFDDETSRIVMMKKHTVHLTLKFKETIDFDVYADLSSGIYEIGDLHALTRNMLNVKKLCLSYDAREMNTTERLYPENRRGAQTSTSGL